MASATALAPSGSGLDLRLRRTAAGVSQVALAERMGVARQRIGQVEGMYRPPRRLRSRYLAALAELEADR